MQQMQTNVQYGLVCFTIHFYDPCLVRPSTPDLWCITAATEVSFLYLMLF